MVVAVVGLKSKKKKLIGEVKGPGKIDGGGAGDAGRRAFLKLQKCAKATVGWPLKAKKTSLRR